MIERYILDDAGKPIAEPDLMKWARWFEKAPRHLVLTEMNDICVSTVFLGLDHSFGVGPPLLFESMVFAGQRAIDQRRYATVEEAKAGHNELVGAHFRKMMN